MVIASTQTLQNVFSNAVDTHNFFRQVKISLDIWNVYIVCKQYITLTDMRASRPQQPLTIVEPH